MEEMFKRCGQATC